MTHTTLKLFAALLAATSGLTTVRAQLTPDQVRSLPAPAEKTVQFAEDIAPILDARCTKCHGRGKAKGDFSLETRESLLKGGATGSAVEIGGSETSYLIELVSGLDPDNVMPQKGTKLTSEEVGLLRAWIDQGLVWDSDMTFAKKPPVNLHPVKPELPPVVHGVEHPIDRLLKPYLDEQDVRLADAVGDAPFARRVHLDLIGLLPSPAELEVFVGDRDSNKREKLVDRLLANDQRYAEHWLTFWNDLLRNDYRGTGYIDGGRKQITSWLFESLAENKPFDAFVAELIDPTEASEGFVKGIVWRGVVNASQTPEMQAAQNISQVFMGVNLKCASCHDSFINDWALADAYGMASIYADEPLEMYECDKPTGRKMAARFLYSELGEIPSDLTQAKRRERLAEIMTSRDNGRLTRTIVNRLWRKFMGRGLVEPVDDMEQPAWHPDLLDWLAEDLAGHGYNLKRTMKWIVTSRAYQAPAIDLSEQESGDFVFRGPAIRRMTAEQYRDALGSLTGVWFEKPDAKIEWTEVEPVAREDSFMPGEAQWIWSEREAASRATPETIYFRKQFTLEREPEEAMAVVACDNSYILYVNGHKVATGGDYQHPNFADLSPHLRVGVNVLAVAGTNHMPDNKPPSAENAPRPSDANPAGLVAYVRIRAKGRVLDFATDETWRWSRRAGTGWETMEEADDWKPAAVMGKAGMPPWNYQGQLQAAMSTALLHGDVRASLVASDPLMTALGRPPREQLLTVRNPTATTLQGLELTNGDTLSELLRRGAAAVLEKGGASAGPLTRRVFLKALGRSPTAEEIRLAEDLLGEPVQREGVEDLLWSVAMLPEFQLIY